MKKKQTEKICHDYSALKYIVILIAIIHAYFFINGFRLSADDVSYHWYAMNGITDSIKYISSKAIEQGRIVHFPDLVTSLFGAYYADYVLFRVFYVVLYFANFFLFSLYVNRAFGINYFWIMAFILFAFHPLDYFHTSPGAYPFKISFPTLLILIARLRILDLRINNNKNDLKSNFPWFILCLFAMLFSEYAFAFALGTFLIDYVARVLKSNKKSSQPSLLQNCVKQVFSRYTLHDIYLAILFLIFYLGFRFYFPSSYDGNKLPESLNLILTLKTLTGHILGGSVFLSFIRESPIPFFYSNTLNFIHYFLLFSYFILSYVFFENLSRRFAINSDFSQSYLIVFFAGLFSLFTAIIVTLPVAVTDKYQTWCTMFTSCVFLDSSLSYLGFGFFIGVLILFISFMASKIKLVGPIVFAFVFATLTTTALLNNIRVEQSMKSYVLGWDRAKALACFSDSTLSKYALSSIVDPNHRISMHPNFDQDKYWSMYISKQRSNLSNDDCQNKFGQLFPNFYENQKIFFDNSGKANSFLAGGWSSPESWGTWSASVRANLFIPNSHDYDFIEIMLSAFINNTHPIQRFDLYFDDQYIQTFKFNNAEDNIIKLNIKDLCKSNNCSDKLGLLSFKFHDAVSPLELGLSRDERKLAIGIKYIAFNNFENKELNF
jgi:hypothetical protein